jgi:hypothetical protein
LIRFAVASRRPIRACGTCGSVTAMPTAAIWPLGSGIAFAALLTPSVVRPSSTAKSTLVVSTRALAERAGIGSPAIWRNGSRSGPQ